MESLKAVLGTIGVLLVLMVVNLIAAFVFTAFDSRVFEFVGSHPVAALAGLAVFSLLEIAYYGWKSSP